MIQKYYKNVFIHCNFTCVIVYSVCMIHSISCTCCFWFFWKATIIDFAKKHNVMFWMHDTGHYMICIYIYNCNFRLSQMYDTILQHQNSRFLFSFYGWSLPVYSIYIWLIIVYIIYTVFKNPIICLNNTYSVFMQRCCFRSTLIFYQFMVRFIDNIFMCRMLILLICVLHTIEHWY